MLQMQYLDKDMDKETLEFIINKLTELMVKQSIEDKKRGKDTYVKKTRSHQDLIKFFKELI